MCSALGAGFRLLGLLYLAPLMAQFVGPPTFFLTSSSGLARVNQATSIQLWTTGGVGPVVFVVDNGSLPPGLSLSSDGVLFGVPTQVGSFPFFIRARDGANATTRATFLFEVVSTSFEFVQTALPNGRVGVSYAAGLNVAGSVPPVALRIDSGNLPLGLSLSSSGIEGTPVLPGTSIFTLAATHAAAGVALRQYAIRIDPAAGSVGNPLALRLDPLPNGLLGVPYSAVISANGGSPPYQFQLTSGQLPAGLTLLGNGSISGTPTGLVSPGFDVEVRDAAGAALRANYRIAMSASTLFDFTSQSLPEGLANTLYTNAIGATGGVAPYRFSISLGSLPTGLSLGSTGLFSGSPVGSGPNSFTLRVTDSTNRFIERSYTLTINPNNTQTSLTFLTNSLPVGVVGTAYSANLLVASTNTPISYRALSGTLPPGLNLTSGGTIGGTPTVPGRYNFTVLATDARGNSAQQALTLEVRDPADAEPTLLPLAILNQPYSTQLSGFGNAGPFTFTREGGLLPVIMELSRDGRLAGEPRFPGVGGFEFTVRVTDSRGVSILRKYLLKVVQTVLRASLTPLPEARVRVPYTASLSVAGGAGPYGFTLFQGELPTGITFDAATNRITGVTEMAGTYPLVFRLRDVGGVEGDASVTLVVRSEAVTFSGAALPDGRVTEAYRFQLSSSGGASPYRYLLIGGSLPAGLQLASDGVISGTPTQVGSFSALVRSTDANGTTAQATLTLNIRAAAPTIQTLTLPEGSLNTPYVAVVEGRSPAGLPVSYRLGGGALPTGLALASDGRISGTPTAAGTFGFTVQISDSQGGTGLREFTIRILDVGGPLSIRAAVPPSGRLYFPYSFRFAAGGGFPPYVWSLAAGTPPSGLRLDSATGNLTGVPLAYGFYTFRVRLTDSRGSSTDAPPHTVAVFEATRLANGQTGRPYSAEIAFGAGRYSLDPSAVGGLPPGLSLSATGTLSGTPTASGEFTFGVSVVGADGQVTQNPVSLTVLAANTTEARKQGLPGGTVGTSYRQQLNSFDGLVASSITLAAGALPPGIQLDSANGVLSGIPQAAGDYFFTLTIRVGGSAENTAFRLSVAPAGSPAIAALTHAASYGSDAVAPGQLVIFFGAGLGPALLQQFTVTNGFLPKELALTRVLFDGLAVPIIYTSAGQLSAIAPFDLLGRLQTNVTVEYNGMVSAPLLLRVSNAQPGIFTADGSGRGLAAILNEDGTLNGPSNPAAADSVIVFYATGGGRMNPSGVDGRVARAVSNLFQPSAVQIGGQTADLLYAGNAPGIVEGAIQVNARIPRGLGTGARDLRLSVGGTLSPAGVVIWVR
jgi:large repetitive protein